MDILIPLGTGSNWQNNEIKYCLRSIEKNLIDLDRVFIIGYLPDFINKDKVVYINYDDPFKHNKDANIIRKVLKAIDLGISNNFIRISDDQLFLKPIKSKDIIPLYKFEFNNYDWTKLNNWRRRLKNTYEILKLENKSTFNFDSHIPVVYNGYCFKDVFNKYIWSQENGGYTINSLYFNNINCNKVKLVNEKICFEKENNEEIKLNGEQYLGYNNKGLSIQLKEKIENLFSEKSKYEY